MRLWLIILVLLTFSCANQNVISDYEARWNCDCIEETSNKLVVIKTTGKILYGTIEMEKTLDAIGFPVGDNMVVALTHATEVPDYLTQRTPFGMMSVPVKVLEENHTINGEPLTLIGRYEDISLFYYPNRSAVAPWGDSQKLRVGHLVLIPGFSFSQAFNVKDGMVSNTALIEKNYGLKKNAGKSYLISAFINRGDSGSPVLAKRNGRLELVGIAWAVVSRNNDVGSGMGFVFHSDYLQRAIKHILNNVTFTGVGR